MFGVIRALTFTLAPLDLTCKASGVSYSMTGKGLPHFTSGIVIEGFGRGSKDLGIPTANYGPEVVNNLPQEVTTGVYYGWARVAQGQVHKMVMSIGWNPYFGNTQKSMETHIMHQFDSDFYGQTLRVCILGYIRPEKNFDTLQALIEAINNDISTADRLLTETENSKFAEHEYFFSSDYC